MSDETAVVRYSSFWPQFILMIGLTIWCGYQLYAINTQRVEINRQYEALAPSLDPSQKAEDRLRSVMDDLLSISSKDANAAQILRESVQAGILRVKQTSDTNAAPVAPPK